MAPFAAAALGSVVRWGLGVISTAGAVTSVEQSAEGAVQVQSGDEVQLFLSLLGQLLTLAWSLWQKKRAEGQRAGF